MEGHDAIPLPIHTPGRLALLLVVLPQARVAAIGVVTGRDLAGQIRVPAARRELVQSHHQHTVQQGYATRTRNGAGMHQVCGIWAQSVDV